jgi:hypothetical protein
MQKVAVITCFSYLGTKKYVFNPEYLRSDLRRIIAFSHNKAGCPLDRIYVLTDLQPSEQIRREILDDFQAEVKIYLEELRIPRAILSEALKFSQSHENRPLEWLRRLSRRIEPKRPEHLYRRLLRQILPVIRSGSVVEFASLFTNLTIISGEAEYRRAIDSIFRLPMTHLLFYYTGHGIRIQSANYRQGVYLIIPRSGQIDLQPRETIQALFQQILGRVSSFIVFDCCHAETLIDLPHKLTFTPLARRSLPQSGVDQDRKNEVIYLSSTLHNQTCGFYTSGKEYGSLYTYYLIKFLKSTRGANLSQLRHEVEERIRQYRERQMKPPQNMLIGLSHREIRQLPRWLFERSEPGFDLIEA